MKIQIEFPDKHNVDLTIYKVKNEFNTKADALVDLALRQLKKR